MISFHFLNGTNTTNFFTNDTAHGAGQLWSQIPDIPAYQEFNLPFPVVVADSRPVGSNLTTALGPDPVVYEVCLRYAQVVCFYVKVSMSIKITPYEFGSWDPNLSAMTNVTFIGTNLVNGTPANTTACVTGFDQVGFMIGTSSSLFNVSFRSSIR